MNGTQTQTHPMHRFLPETIAIGSVTEGFGGLAAIILGILGLAGVFTNIVASVATIVIGAVFLTDSMTARARVYELSSQNVLTTIGRGAGAGFFAGIAGIVLGILSFFHPTPEKYIAIAVLVFGAALLLCGGTLARLNSLWGQAQGATAMTSSGSVFIGVGVTVLGLLAVIGLAPMTLALVGLLSMGAASMISGPAAEVPRDVPS